MYLLASAQRPLVLVPLPLFFPSPSARCCAALSQLRAKQPTAAGAQGAAFSPLFFFSRAAPRSHLLILFPFQKSLFPFVIQLDSAIHIQTVHFNLKQIRSPCIAFSSLQSCVRARGSRDHAVSVCRDWKAGSEMSLALGPTENKRAPVGYRDNCIESSDRQ